jgi:hypothetical protein
MRPLANTFTQLAHNRSSEVRHRSFFVVLCRRSALQVDTKSARRYAKSTTRNARHSVGITVDASGDVSVRSKHSAVLRSNRWPYASDRFERRALLPAGPVSLPEENEEGPTEESDVI